MHQYVSRRCRCWKLLKELDSDIQLSEGHRADMLLDLAGIGRQEKIMIQASIGNVRDFDKVAEALLVQHPRIHLKEKSKKPVKSKGKGDGKPRKGKSRGKGKHKKGRSSSSNTAHYTEVEEYEDDGDNAVYYADDYD